MRDFVFQIWPKLTYDALKEYKSFMKQKEAQELKDQLDGDGSGKTSNSADDARLHQLKKKLSEERGNNTLNL